MFVLSNWKEIWNLLQGLINMINSNPNKEKRKALMADLAAAGTEFRRTKDVKVFEEALIKIKNHLS